MRAKFSDTVKRKVSEFIDGIRGNSTEEQQAILSSKISALVEYSGLGIHESRELSVLMADPQNRTAVLLRRMLSHWEEKATYALKTRSDFNDIRYIQGEILNIDRIISLSEDLQKLLSEIDNASQGESRR